MRILHCADVHIGKEFTINRLKSRQRRAEIAAGFIRTVRYCKEQGIDVMLIAGDLFDHENIEMDVLMQIKEAFESVADTDIYIAAGNHDALTISSPYRKIEWPENVTLFDGTAKVIERQDKGYRIWGCGFETAYVDNHLLSGVRMPKDECINLGILHGQTVGVSGTSIYNAITDAEIAKSGLDYLALGHVHKQTEILKQGNTFYAYSGALEGQGFDEDGIRGFYTGEITRETLDEGKCSLEYVSQSTRQYTHLEVDATDIEGKPELVKRILDKAAASDEAHYENDLYKITIVGSIDQDISVNTVAIQAELAPLLYYVKVRDNTSLRIDYEELAEQNSLKGMFAARILEEIRQCRQKNDEEGVKKYKKALEIGIKAFSGEVDIDED